MNGSTINPTEQTVVYSSAFSELVFHPDQSMIVATWKENSKKLVEKGVMDEITRLLDYIGIYKVKNVIVDVRHYAFTNNERIQHWINTWYVPKLMESGIEKYAFVVEKASPIATTDSNDESPLRVEYFTSFNEAVGWMK